MWQWNDGDDLIEKKNSLCHCDFQPTGVHTNTEDQNSIIVHGEKIVGRAQSGLQMLDRREVVTECKDSVKIENVVSQAESVTGTIHDLLIGLTPVGESSMIKLLYNHSGKRCLPYLDKEQTLPY